MKKTIYFFLITLLLVSCSKYEDGPSISLRSPEKRLSGKWRLSELLYNDKDITVAYYAPQYDLYPYNIYADWSDAYFISITHTDGGIIAKSALTLNKKKTEITFGLIPEAPYEAIARDIFTVIPNLSGDNKWTILRLKNDELWIRTQFESNNFELHFELLADFNDY